MAVYAGAGRLMAFAGMITLAAMGLATVLQTSELLFFMIKVAGGLYLFWIAYQLWTADVSDNTGAEPQGKSLFQLARQEFLLAAGNPKAILIFTAFLPQFVQPNEAVGMQFLVLGGIFLVLEWGVIAGYAFFGRALRYWFSRPDMRRLFNRIFAGLLGSGGVGLLLAHQ